MLLGLAFGLFIGLISSKSAMATPQWSFAGYQYTAQANQGTQADIGYTNPYVPTGQSGEWVMSSNNGPYVQSGWIKKSTFTTGPSDFFEYKCSSVCQFIYFPISGARNYKVELGGGNWCGYAGGSVLKCVSTTTAGMTNAGRGLFSGETSDTDAQLGGTSTAHLRLNYVRFKTTSGTWLQPNTVDMADITTAGTRYRASKGFTSPYTWVDNWTQ